MVPYGPSNPGLRELPIELGQLSNLWQLDIEDLVVNNVPAEIRKEGRVPRVPTGPHPGVSGQGPQSIRLSSGFCIWGSDVS